MSASNKDAPFLPSPNPPEPSKESSVQVSNELLETRAIPVFRKIDPSLLIGNEEAQDEFSKMLESLHGAEAFAKEPAAPSLPSLPDVSASQLDVQDVVGVPRIPRLDYQSGQSPLDLPASVPENLSVPSAQSLEELSSALNQTMYENAASSPSIETSLPEDLASPSLEMTSPAETLSPHQTAGLGSTQSPLAISEQAPPASSPTFPASSDVSLSEPPSQTLDAKGEQETAAVPPTAGADLSKTVMEKEPEIMRSFLSQLQDKADREEAALTQTVAEDLETELELRSISQEAAVSFSQTMLIDSGSESNLSDVPAVAPHSPEPNPSNTTIVEPSLAETVLADTGMSDADPSVKDPSPGRFPDKTPLSLPSMPEVSAETNRQQESMMRSKLSTVLPHVNVVQGAPSFIPSQDERYQHIRRLGEGAMGEVELVQDNDILRRVALKRLKSGQARSQSLFRFIEEIRTVGQLQHPNIVPIHDVGVDEDGNYFFVMKYVEGQTLAELIKRLRNGDQALLAKYTFTQRARLFLEILYAIQFAHQQGFIHRDIKPENIMVGPFGEVMIMDWGLSKQIDRSRHDSDAVGGLHNDMAKAEVASRSAKDARRMFSTQFGALLGTPAYMSPEQALGAQSAVGKQSDIYSLCAVFYELLTLQHYLEHKLVSVNVLLSAVASEMPSSAMSVKQPVQDLVPAEMAHYVMKGLAKEPEERFDSVDEMIQELILVLEGIFKVECPVTFSRRVGHAFNRFVNNYKTLGMFVVMLLVVSVLSSGFQLTHWLLSFF